MRILFAILAFTCALITLAAWFTVFGNIFGYTSFIDGIFSFFGCNTACIIFVGIFGFVVAGILAWLVSKFNG